MTRILITPEEIRSIAGLFKQKSGDSQAMIQELGSAINRLDQTWDGASNAKFMQDFHHWQSTMNQFVTVLDEINKQLITVAQRFEQADAG